MVVLWKKLSPNKDEFISDILLASTKPNHEHFFFGDKGGYKLVLHPEMRGIEVADPSLCQWFRKAIPSQLDSSLTLSIAHNGRSSRLVLQVL